MVQTVEKQNISRFTVPQKAHLWIPSLGSSSRWDHCRHLDHVLRSTFANALILVSDCLATTQRTPSQHKAPKPQKRKKHRRQPKYPKESASKHCFPPRHLSQKMFSFNVHILWLSRCSAAAQLQAVEKRMHQVIEAVSGEAPKTSAAPGR